MEKIISSMDPNDDQRLLKVVMFPWLAHGHISSFLELAHQLVRRNFYVYLCSTPVNLSSIKQRFEPGIELVELHLPILPNLPAHYHTTRNLPHHLIPTLMEAFDSAKPAFTNLLATLSPDCLIYDYFQPWAPEAASEQSIPAIPFLTISAASVFYAYRLGNPPENSNEFPFPTIQLSKIEIGTFQQLLEGEAGGITIFERFRLCVDRASSIIAIKTMREMEGKIIDYLSLYVGKELVPVAPLVRQVQKQSCSITEWLDRKPRDSVIYVSFGSEYFMSKEEIEEMAQGLELSGVDFIWVVRFPKDEKEEKEPEMEEVLPSGFLERVGERGMVVMGWTEQVKILSHPSTGGFLTHCGWGSLVEGLRLGVWFVALPLQYEQHVNARLAAAELGVAVEIEREWSSSLSFRREKVAKGIRMVMVEKEGEEVRRTAKKMGEYLRCRADDIDVFVGKLIERLQAESLLKVQFDPL